MIEQLFNGLRRRYDKLVNGRESRQWLQHGSHQAYKITSTVKDRSTTRAFLKGTRDPYPALLLVFHDNATPAYLLGRLTTVDLMSVPDTEDFLTEVGWYIRNLRGDQPHYTYDRNIGGYVARYGYAQFPFDFGATARGYDVGSSGDPSNPE